MPKARDATITVRALCDSANQGQIDRTTADAEKLRVAGVVSEYQDMDVVVRTAVQVSIADVRDCHVITCPMLWYN